MSLGKKEPGDPRHWQIRDGRLFFNSSAIAKLLWRIVPGRRASADRRWGGKSSGDRGPQ